MAIINEYFDDFQGMIWVQPDGPNTEVYPLACHNTDGIDEPLGGVTTRYCRNFDGSWSAVNRSQGVPGDVTLDIETMKAKQISWLQRQAERRCPQGVYFHHAFCGRTDVFLNYDQGKLAQNSLITNKSYSNMARGNVEADATPEKTMQTFSLSAGYPSPEYYKLVYTTVVLPGTETEPLRDIAFCNALQCRGPCGSFVDICTDGHIVADALSGSKADGYDTDDGGGSYIAWNTQPFAITEDVVSIVCYQIDRGVTRLLVACGTAGAAGLRVGYSDDDGLTWNVAVVAATATDYAMHSGALFALDHRHIWLCTFEADVYFSADGGLTWTDQNAPVPAANESLYYIHFINEDYGWAVGGYRVTPTGLLVETTDGGAHWNVMATEPQTEMCVWVAVLDAYHLWVGMDDGTVWYSNDWGANWLQRTMPLTMVNTGDGMFIDDYCGGVCGYYNDGVHDYPIVFRTFNGGHDWEYELYDDDYFSTTIEQFGLNALWVCSYNEIHTVGELLASGDSIVWILKAPGL